MTTYPDFFMINMCIYIVHEHNHTRVLVPEVLCSLEGQETQNVPTVAATATATSIVSPP